MTTTLFRNVRLVDPAADIDGYLDVLVAEGKVRRVATHISPDEALRGPRRGGEGGCLTVVEGHGLWLWPGLVDVHVHFREPGFTEKETFRTGGMAAAAGGYTSVVCEPNTEPPIDSVEVARRLAEQAGHDSPVHVYFKAAMTRARQGRKPSDIRALSQEESIVALSDDGDPVPDEGLMGSICRAAAEMRMLLAPHCEDSQQALKALAAGAQAGFQRGEPYTNEAGYIERDLRLAAAAGCRIHLSHVSLARSLEAIERFKREAPNPAAATFEVTPHHLLLCAEDFPDGAPKVNPPLRSAEDRKALREALASGRVDAIASDHAPHTARDKATGASGLIGLETTLGLVLTHFVLPGEVSVSRAASLLSLSPARIFSLPAGTLKRGSPADMVLIDPSLEWRVEPDKFRSKSRNTPFAGWELRGGAVATYVRGQEVFCTPGLEERKETAAP
jgi:dihydroorotase